mmetsp:Transcript_43/g.107  ORF Transcript_43/g.107 Transcript_43/m.107 type:complete len:265 (+) Transcript_43:209-1003(+)
MSSPDCPSAKMERAQITEALAKARAEEEARWQAPGATWQRFVAERCDVGTLRSMITQRDEGWSGEEWEQHFEFARAPRPNNVRGHRTPDARRERAPLLDASRGVSPRRAPRKRGRNAAMSRVRRGNAPSPRAEGLVDALRRLRALLRRGGVRAAPLPRAAPGRVDRRRLDAALRVLDARRGADVNDVSSTRVEETPTSQVRRNVRPGQGPDPVHGLRAPGPLPPQPVLSAEAGGRLRGPGLGVPPPLRRAGLPGIRVLWAVTVD